MASFSYQHNPFVLDSVFLTNTNLKMTDLLRDANASSFPYLPSYSSLEIANLSGTHESNWFGDSSKVADSDNQTDFGDETEVMGQQKTEDSTSTVVEGTGQILQQKSSISTKRKTPDSFGLNSAQSKDTKEDKGRKQKKSTNSSKERNIEKKPKSDKKNQKKASQEPPTGYIHVRARRGQATDSHSLAERVRREKISERMKMLQGLVPGCDKVTGKALMLDEIINYVQSLQNQVEFLSMKLASVNPMLYDFSTDLDAFTAPSEKLGTSQSPLPCEQQATQTQPAAAFADATTAATKETFPSTNSYTLLDCSVSPLLHGQTPTTFSLEYCNQVGYNYLCSFQ